MSETYINIPISSTDTPKLNEALAKAQGQFLPIIKNKTANVQMKSGGTYKFKYADLCAVIDATVPALSANGLAVTMPIVEDHKGFVIKAILRHSSGETISTMLPLHIPEGRPQELGSLLTYYRRYLLSGLLNVTSEEDEDGNLASGNSAEIKNNTSAGKTPPAVPTKKEIINHALSLEDKEAHKIGFAGEQLIDFGSYKKNPQKIKDMDMVILKKDVRYWEETLTKKGGLDGTSPAAMFVKYGNIWINSKDSSSKEPTAYDEAKNAKPPKWDNDDGLPF